MLQAFTVAIVVLFLPAVVIGVAIAPWCGDDAAAYVLGPGVGITGILLTVMTASRFGLSGLLLTATPWLLAATVVVVRRGRLPPLRWIGLPALAAVVSVLVFGWPFLHHDWPGVLGYNISNDSITHAIFGDYLASQPRLTPGSAYESWALTYQKGTYPLGSHVLLATAATPARGALNAFDPVMAVLLALTAFPAYWLLRRSDVPAMLACVGAVIAVGGYLQMQFYLQGYLPQMACTPFIFTAIGLAYEAIVSRRLTPAFLAGLAIGAAAAVYSALAIVDLAPTLVLLAVACLIYERQRVRALRRIALQTLVVLVGVVIMLLPVAERTVSFARGVGVGGLQAAGPQGNLQRAADARVVLGTWIGPDFRQPPDRYKRSDVGMLVAAVLVVVGLGVAIRRRQIALLAAVVGGAVTVAFISVNSGIYYTAKSYQVFAIPVACAVVAGGAAMLRAQGRLRIVAALLGVALLGLYGIVVEESVQASVDAARNSPPEISELGRLASVMPRGPALALVTGDWTKYELRTAIVPYDHQTTNPIGPPRVGHGEAGFYDIGSFQPRAVVEAVALVVPRIGGQLPPPPPYRLRDVTPRFELWTRPVASAPNSGWLPLEPAGHIGGTTLPPGGSLVMAGEARRPVRVGGGVQESFYLPLTAWTLAGSGWARFTTPGYIVAISLSGVPARSSVRLVVGGPYRITAIGVPATGTTVSVDGRVLPSQQQTTNDDGIYPLGTVTLAPGVHQLAIRPPTAGYSLMRAVTLEFVGKPSAGALCVLGRTYSISSEAPALLPPLPAGTRLVNCDRRPLTLDWIAPVPP